MLGPPVLRVLFVCTANRCRSPLAEHLLRRALQSSPASLPGVDVASAGLRAYQDLPMDPRALDVLSARGVADADRFRTRRLAPSHVRDADLVLAASRCHRDEALTLAPTASRRVFTLKEFRSLLDGVDRSALPASGAGRGREIVQAAAEQRGRRRPAAPAEWDLPDPVNLDPPAFETCAEVIEHALSPLVELLTLGRG